MKRHILFYTLLLTLVFTACKDEPKVPFNFGSTMEAPASEDKTHLVQEKWIYWDEGDSISVASDKTSSALPGNLVSGQDQLKGIFYSELPESSEEFCALFPYDVNNAISYGSGSFSVKVNFPKTQKFLDDYSFGMKACPMVAWSEHFSESEDSLLFHSLGGIVRLQFYSTLGTSATIKTISVKEISDTPKQISGMFDVINYNRAEPHLQATASSPTDAQRTITIDCQGQNRTIGSSAELCTFYLVLPAYVISGTTQFKLGVTVTNTNNKQCIKTVNVKIRRNNIIKVPALNITAWGDAPSGTGNTNIGIVGNGTQDRPFQIYSANELIAIRDSMNLGRKINGQTINANSYFRIMRSDIVLNNTNWTSSIKHFKGQLYYGASNSETPGITNNSNIPIIDTIDAGASVHDLDLKVNYNRDVMTKVNYAPLCNYNAGTIANCRTSSSSTITLNSDYSDPLASGIAGICLTNVGTIDGCVNQATITANSHIAAGICMDNRGTVTRCYISSPASLITGASASGIVARNAAAGTVSECYFSANVSSSNALWGCIVGTNNGTVTKCYVAASGVVNTNGSYGGIVNKNEGSGTVNYCYNSTDLAMATTQTSIFGGIVATMAGGTVVNCYSNRNTTTFTSGGTMGGIVGIMIGGTVANCFNRNDINGTGVAGSFVGSMSGGTINNCYSRAGMTTNDLAFAGSTTGGTISNCYNYKVSQTGVTSFTNPSQTVSSYSNLTEALNAQVSGHSDYYLWTGSNYPSLTNSHSSSKKANRR